MSESKHWGGDWYSFFNSDTSSCNVDFKGNFLDKKDIEAVDQKGKELKKHDSTLGREVPLSSISIEDALNIQINYQTNVS